MSLKLTYKQLKFLDSRGGRSAKDVKIDVESKLFVWMCDQDGVENCKIYLPLEEKRSIIKDIIK